MEKLTCAIDTSAALSLGSTGKFQLSTEFFSFLSPGRVNEELIEISENDDNIGKIAKNILQSGIIKFTTLKTGLQNNIGEIEVIKLANQLKADFVLMDDIKARDKLQNKCNCPIRFSPFIVFFLYKKKKLSYDESNSAIEKMKIERKWDRNLITEYAAILLKKNKKINDF